MSVSAQKIEESRKTEERAAFERLYRARKTNAKPSFRSLFLFDSEQAFNRRLAELARGKDILEIGCGDGTHAILAARSGATSVLGVDISKEGIKLAGEAAAQADVAAKVNFTVMDVEALEIPDASFDLVINHEIFSSVDLTKVLPELARVLRPGGRILSKESLGHNPLFNFNRWLNNRRGTRTNWAINHIWRFDDFILAAKYFRVVSAESYHLLVMFAAPIQCLPWQKLKTGIVALFRRADRKLLQHPRLRTLAFKLIFEMEKR